MHRGRILLLTPNLKGVRDGLNRIQPPLGPMIAAAAMRRQGHDVVIHDAALEGWHNQVAIDEKTVLIGQPDSEIEEVIATHSPDVIGISALFTNLMHSAHRIARLAKKVCPGAKVILGGNHISNAIADYVAGRRAPHPNLSPNIPDLEDENIDFAMRGEVDLEFPRLADALINGSDISQIPGLVTRNGTQGDYAINPPPARIADLDELPVPARDLVNMEGYFDIGAFHATYSESRRVLSVMASRGCPEQCTFCTTPEMWGSIVRWRSTGSIANEIREARERYRIEEIQFEDDTLTARRKNLLELCTELERIGLPWCTPNGTKANYHMATQPDLYQAMADAGCYQITLACESGVQRVLDEIIRKRLRLEEILLAIENAKRVGMFVHTFWILGYPGETYEEMQETVRFAMGCGADSFSFSILSPLPGTPIHRQVVKENLWWPGRTSADLMYRSSLVRVPGFDSPEEFERFVAETRVKANRLLEERDPERFRRKYGENTDEKRLFRQTL
jgi:radical SAM superfamily enzyme YgiQ (UPF0313 family)